MSSPITIPAGGHTLEIPDGRHASLEQMQTFGTTLQRFVRAQEASLARVDDPHRHNQIVDYLELLADAYNTQLKVFRETEAARHQTLAAMLLALRNLQEPR